MVEVIGFAGVDGELRALTGAVDIGGGDLVLGGGGVEQYDCSVANAGKFRCERYFDCTSCFGGVGLAWIAGACGSESEIKILDALSAHGDRAKDSGFGEGQGNGEGTYLCRWATE